MTEKQLQKQVEDYLRLKRVPYLHCTTFMRVRTYGKCVRCQVAISGWKNVAIPGMTGWPDLIIFFKRWCVFIELKHGKNRLTAEQAGKKAELESQGYLWYTMRTWDEAKEKIDYFLQAEGKHV